MHSPYSAQTFAFCDDSIQTAVQLRVHRLSAVQKVAYRLAAKCTVVFGHETQGELPVTLLFRSGTHERDALDTARLFFQELTDQELREQIGDETRAVRALILAHAFSNTDLIRRK